MLRPKEDNNSPCGSDNLVAGAVTRLLGQCGTTGNYIFNLFGTVVRKSRSASFKKSERCGDYISLAVAQVQRVSKEQDVNEDENDSTTTATGPSVREHPRSHGALEVR